MSFVTGTYVGPAVKTVGSQPPSQSVPLLSQSSVEKIFAIPFAL